MNLRTRVYVAAVMPLVWVAALTLTPFVATHLLDHHHAHAHAASVHAGAAFHDLHDHGHAHDADHDHALAGSAASKPGSRSMLHRLLATSPRAVVGVAADESARFVTRIATVLRHSPDPARLSTVLRI